MSFSIVLDSKSQLKTDSEKPIKFYFMFKKEKISTIEINIQKDFLLMKIK